MTEFVAHDGDTAVVQARGVAWIHEHRHRTACRIMCIHASPRIIQEFLEGERYS